jgi:hypothetical protein
MARRFRPLIWPVWLARFAALVLLVAVVPASRTACGAPAATPSPQPPNPSPMPSLTPALPSSSPISQPSSTAKPKAQKSDAWAEASRIFETLSPDQKKKFLDNLDQWKNMSPEEQELFRDRELLRREKIAAEIQDSLTKTGLHLDSDQREVFALRYTQERRKIEEALRKEMDHERQSMVSDMLSRLKVEFAPASAASSKSAVK